MNYIRLNILILLLLLVFNNNFIFANKHQKQKEEELTTINFKLPTTSVPVYSIKSLSTGFSIYSGNDSTSIAQAGYSNEMMSMGWAYLSITTNSEYDDDLQAEAAGYIEGYLSYEMIWQYWYNLLVNEYNNKTVPVDIVNWVNDNLFYMKQQIANNPSDPYWLHVNLVLLQLNGMFNGYNQANQDSSRELSFTEFLIINMDSDIGDIIPSFNSSTSGYIYKKTKSKLFNEHCSGLVKLTDDLQELYTAHTTWSGYFYMVRMFKSYNFKYSTLAHSKLTIFSGYPGTLASLDDFYLLDSRLVVLETTNGINNNDLYKLITPQSVCTWMRVIVTNRLANGGKSWCETFSLYNSGTYNNQWMIIDYNKFVKGVKVRDGTLFVLEQLPGYIEYDDVTNILRTGYWPSYNVPYFETIFNMSGYNDESSSGYESYEEDVRSQIFRRDANKVQNLTDFQAIMRYNNFQNDPLAKGNAGNQISSRFDLNPQDSGDCDAVGGVDSKVTSFELVNQLLVIAQSGPTHDQEPPFEWSTNNWQTQYPTIGMPNLFDFNWVTFSDQSYSINN